MWELKACTVCFSTGVKLYSLNVGAMRSDFNLVSGLKTHQGNGMPDYLCVECSAYVRKFKGFRDKCHRAYYALQQMLITNKEIRKHNLKLVNREQLKIMPSLAYTDFRRSSYEESQFEWKKKYRTNFLKRDSIPIAHCSTLTKEDTFEDEMKYVSNEPDVKVEEIQKVIKEQKITPRQNTEMDMATEIEIDMNTMIKDDAVDFTDNDDHFNNESDVEDFGPFLTQQLDDKVDGSKLNEEYAKAVPISVKEAKAAALINTTHSIGKFLCTCGRKFVNEKRMKIHSRMHDKHVSGNFHCEMCDYYYKTAFLLQCHMTEKHMYKYLCKECPEVSFSRRTAKAHFVVKHIHKENTKRNWDLVDKPSWIGPKGGKRAKGYSKVKTKIPKKMPEDFPRYSPICQEEQYAMVDQRKTTRNYLEAKYRCDLCYRGYRLPSTYSNHMVKHDSAKSGIHQCDMCKLFFCNQRKMYKHMMMNHLFKYSCQYCEYVSTNRGQALQHYRWHKNVVYDCPHCDKKFTKLSTQFTHVRLKHPSSEVCNLCGHSFVSSNGVYCHKQIAHTKEEIDEAEAQALLNAGDKNYCADCKVQFASDQAYLVHLGSSNKHVETNVSVSVQIQNARRDYRQCRNRPDATAGAAPWTSRGRPRGHRKRSEILNTGTTTANRCEVCDKFLASDVVAKKHYETDHPGTEYLKRYMCDVCGHTTRQYANLLVHMRTHTNEKPYQCPRCDRRFSMPSNRDRHLVVHTGEKKYECQHCGRRFTQSSAVKLHIQTVHMKIPYAPWDKKNRKRRKDAEPTTAGFDVITQPVAVLPPAPQHKLLLDTQGEFISAYITYGDE